MTARAHTCGQICFHICAKASILLGSADLMFMSSGPPSGIVTPCGQQQDSSDLTFFLLVLRPDMQLFLGSPDLSSMGKPPVTNTSPVALHFSFSLVSNSSTLTS